MPVISELQLRLYAADLDLTEGEVLNILESGFSFENPVMKSPELHVGEYSPDNESLTRIFASYGPPSLHPRQGFFAVDVTENVVSLVKRLRHY